MRRFSMIAWLALSTAFLAACGGSASDITGETGNGGTSGNGGTTTTTLSIGSGIGSAFQSGMLGISTNALSAGGSTSLQVSIVDQTGALYTAPTTVTFSSPCQAQGLATISGSGSSSTGPAVSTSTGNASATYVASGCSGSDVITASASANSQNLTATGTVTVAQAAIGSISFISATPSNITLKGTGATTNGTSTATSTVIFKVLDTSGGPRANATVAFTLSTSVGGITVSPTSANTDANGQVQTVVDGGTVATTVRVTASTSGSNGSTISTESSALTVSTGIPTSANISLAVKCHNVEAYNLDGVTVPVTVYMTDRFSNPVPDGTTANFQTTLGGIQATCQTGSNSPGSGSCSVNWTSKTPFIVSGNPATTRGTANTNNVANWCVSNSPYCTGTTNGRSAIIVTAIGEESFTDANGSGVFNTADTVPFDPNDKDNNFSSGVGKPWFDTSEPFLNEWELFDGYGTPTYVLGEPFIDFNSNGTRDGPDGLFEGALCSGSLCNTNSSTVSISAGNVIVLSGETAHFTYASGSPPFTLPANISMYIYDENYQAMPAGTTVTYSFSTSSGSAAGPAPAAVPCTAATPAFNSDGSVASAGTLYTFSATPPTSGAVAGTMFVTVTTPLGLVTNFAVPLTN